MPDPSAHPGPPAALRSFSAHPLELIPYFRRNPQGTWRDLLYTLIWNTLLAGLFTLLALVFNPRVPVLAMLGYNLVFAHSIGFLIHASFALLFRIWPRAAEAGMAARFVVFAGIPVVCVVAGFWFAATLLGIGDMQGYVVTARGFLTLAGLSLVMSVILLAVFVPREQAARAEAAVAREQARVAAAERAAAQARLKLLEAQIEPHFLYNTLAHVDSLIEAEPAVARRMLGRLIALLRASAAAAGSATRTTLGAQAELLRAYLEIVELRMGGRIAWSIAVPAELADANVPPMLLQPLAENAVKHGLEPRVEGGRVDVSARREGGTLVLVVADTGVGMGARNAPGGTGLGLANLRARLAALYGDAAGVAIEDQAPTGTRVTVRLPLSGTANAGGAS